MKKNIKANILIILGAMTLSSNAATLSLNATDRGWYDDSGEHNSTNSNYLAGFTDQRLHRNWFAFDLTGVTDVLSASLRVFVPANETVAISGGTTETLTLYEVSTTVALLASGGFGHTDRYNDLGDGNVFGSFSFDRSVQGTFLTIPLNGLFVNAVNLANGSGSIAIGGAITTIQPILFDDEYIFGLSGGAATNSQLIVQTIPEPSSALFVCASSLLLTFRRRNRI